MYINTRIDDSSYPDLKILYQLSFGLNPTVRSLQNKYNTSMFGLKNVGVMAKDENGEPAAYYGVFPITLSYDAKDFLVAQSGDTMTAPNHRKKGLFETLAKAAYALAEELGVKMVFGFPNENSFPGFQKKLSWYFTGVMNRFTIKVFTFPFCELASKYTFLESLYQNYARTRISRYKIELSEANTHCFKFSNVKGQIKRDVNFFNYKLNSEGSALVKIDGFTLFIKHNTHLFIGDVCHIERNQTQALIKTVKKLSKKLACKKVIFTLSPNHWLFDYLNKEITPTPSLPIGFYKIDETILPEEIQFTMVDYDTF